VLVYLMNFDKMTPARMGLIGLLLGVIFTVITASVFNYAMEHARPKPDYSHLPKPAPPPHDAFMAVTPEQSAPKP